MQKELKDLFRTIWRNSNLIGITNEDLEVFASKDTTTIIADFQAEQNSQGTFQSLCHNVQEKLGQQARKGYVENILIYIDMPKGEQGLTMQDLETLNGMQQAIAPNVCQILAIGTHTAGFLRIAVVIGMNKMKTSPTFFSCKGKKIFAFSDTHGLHRQLEIPESADILICAGDAVEDNLNPADYEDFLNWYKSQPAKLRLFTPGNHELSFDIAPLWAETLFKTDDIVLLHDGTFSYDGINFAAITEDTARDIEILPKEIDIVITHHPPVGILDCGVGSESIRKAIETMKPRYHLFGHAHQEGCKSLKEYSTTFINTSHCNELKNTSYEHKSDD